MPHKITNEYGENGVTRAATEVIDGVTYEVVYLTGDDVANRAKIEAGKQNKNGNYRYVMTADWTIPADNGTVNIENNASVIFDLNGYTLTVSGWTATGLHSFLVIYGRKFEVTDSSPRQTGVTQCYLSQTSVASGSPVFGVFAAEEFIVSGGTHYTRMEFRNTTAITLLGGAMQGTNGTFHVFDDSLMTLTIAPWLDATYDADGNLTASRPYDYYAVSTTDLVAGVYNYAYGYAWGLNVAELQKLTIPDDKTYYLWGRGGSGAYEYLGLCCTDGKTWRDTA